MSEMVERVARAVFRVGAPFHGDCCLSDKPDFDRCPCGKEDAIPIARAAIEAMREPSERMKRMVLPMSPLGVIWTTVIDAALSEEKESA